MLVGLGTGEWAVFWPLLPSTLICTGLAVPGLRRPPPRDAATAEDGVAVALAFPAALLLTSAPYLFYGLSPLDAAFEGMSGVTGTGLTRYSDIASQPFAIKFLRAWQQWIGGYAIVTLTVALLPRGAKKAQEMAESDIADDEGDEGQEQPNLRDRARQVTGVYVILTLLCIGLTWATGAAFDIALLHALTAVSTAGFSPLDNSVADLPRLTVVCLMGFALLGAIALSDYLRPVRQGDGMRKLLAVVAALVVLSTAAGGAVYAFERGSGDGVGLFDAMQIGFSAQTTTGFSALDAAALGTGSKLVLSAVMYIGGDVGSTAGGIKLLRFVTLILAVYAIFRPFERRQDTPGGDTGSVLRLVAFWFGLSFAGWALLVAIGHPPVDALFEWSSALNNVGLSVGVSGEGAPAATRLLLIFCMWLGRVEILAVLLLLKPSTWRD